MSEPSQKAEPHAQGQFERDLQGAVVGLRLALRELFEVGGPGLKGGQDLSRRFQINRNVAWKLTRIAGSEQTLEACQHLPGSAGMRIVLESIEREGCPPATLEVVRAAWNSFEQLIDHHAGDRSTFELMLRSMSGEDEAPALEGSRRAAFEGNSAVWGVQARTLFSAHLLAPNPDQPDRVDNGLIGGLVDFRRLRATADWVLGRKVLQGSSGEETDSQEESMSGVDDGGLSLLPEFSSDTVPPLRVVPEEHAQRYVLPAGPVGNPGSLTCTFGWIRRRAHVRGDAGETGYDEHFMRIGTPARWTQLDLLLHGSIAPQGPPELFLYDLIHGLLDFPLTTKTAFRLPLHETLEDLGQGPAALASEHIPRYEDLMRLATSRMGWPLEEFRAYRVTMAYPPLPAALVLSYPSSAFRRVLRARPTRVPGLGSPGRPTLQLQTGSAEARPMSLTLTRSRREPSRVRRGGFSLLELVIGSAILVSAVGGALRSNLNAQKLMIEARETELAVQLLEVEMAELLAEGAPELLDSAGNFAPGVPLQAPPLLDGINLFYDLPGFAADDPLPEVLPIRLTLQWTSGSGRDRVMTHWGGLR